MPPNNAAQLTPPGTAAIAVIRLCGPGVPALLARRFDRPVRPGRVAHGNLKNDSGILDDPVVACLDEQTVDINVHGGVAVVRGVMELVAAEGFDINPPPVIPADLSAEVLAAVPHARTETALRALLAQPKAWANLNPADAEQILADPSGQWLIRPPLVAITGPANVGKSTLANRLFGTDRAIVADVPGTTRDWVGGIADLHGLAVALIDTPGRRQTDDAIEIAAVAAAGLQIRSADLVVAVIDTSVEPAAVARHILAEHPSGIVAANKSDLPAVWSVPGAIPVSAATGDGVDQLMTAIRRRFGWEPADIDRPRWWTARQREWLGGLGS